MSKTEKKCKFCENTKPISEFYTQPQTGKNGAKWECYDSYCKPCRLKYAAMRRRNIKIQLVEYMGGKCADCERQDIPDIYDFHHIDPSKKDFSISDKPNLSFEKLKSEIKKCVLLCAICHRKRHAGALMSETKSSSAG
jgi:hypothetical protein